VLVAGLLALGVAARLEAQGGGGFPGGGRGRNRQPQSFDPNLPYDGRFTFARIKYSLPLEAYGDIKWSHDYPRGERHFTKIVGELSTIRSRTLQSNILTLDDPELFRFPVAYLCEAGFWRPSDTEVLGMRNYLTKGGFIIFDDFAGTGAWMNFSAQMQRVLPKAKLVRLTVNHPIFDSFYRIKHLDYRHPYYGMPSEFFGVFENNDPSGRLMAIVNFNNDISEYWEFSDEGLFPVDMSNEAYKLGVNYLIYALTR
jgi:hypothetical protein